MKFGRRKKTPPSTNFMSLEYGQQIRAEKAYKKQAQKKRVTVVQGTRNGKPVEKEHWKKKKDGSMMVTHRSKKVGNRWIYMPVNKKGQTIIKNKTMGR